MTSMPDYGPRDAQVAAFIADLAARNDQALWGLEETIGNNLTIGTPGWLWSTAGPDRRSQPSTRSAAEVSGRLLAWYEAGHYALLAVTPRDDGSVRMDVPGEASTVSLPHLARLAPSIAQALVVRDQVTTNAFIEAIAGWPEVVEGYLVERLDDTTRLPTRRSGPSSPGSGLPFALGSVARRLDPVPHDLAFVMVDYQGLQEINDRHGFGVGNTHLLRVAERLSKVADPGVVFRIGGDEFLIATRLPDAAAVRVYVDSLRAAVGQPIDDEPVELSIGVAQPTGPDDDLGRLFEVADQAMGAARRDEAWRPRP